MNDDREDDNIDIRDVWVALLTFVGVTALALLVVFVTIALWWGGV